MPGLRIDDDAFNRMLNGQGQEEQSKPKSKSNPDSKKSMSKEETDQLIHRMKSDLPSIQRSLMEG